MALIISFITLITVWTIHFLFIFIRGILMIGVSDYWKLLLKRDIRIWASIFDIFILITFLFLVPIYVKIPVRVNIAVTYVFLWPILKILLPPQVLLLRSFTNTNLNFSKMLDRSVISNTVSLSPPIDKPIQILGKMPVIHSGFSSKIASENDWRKVVDKYIDIAEVIVMDLSDAGDGLIEEINMLAKKNESIRKLIFVYRDKDSAKVGLEALPSVLKNCVPFLSYDEIGVFHGEYLNYTFMKELHKRSKYLMPSWLAFLLFCALIVSAIL